MRLGRLLPDTGMHRSGTLADVPKGGNGNGSGVTSDWGPASTRAD